MSVEAFDIEDGEITEASDSKNAKSRFSKKNLITPATSTSEIASTPTTASNETPLLDMLRPYFQILSAINILTGLRQGRTRFVWISVAIATNITVYIMIVLVLMQLFEGTFEVDHKSLMLLLMTAFLGYCGLSQTILIYYSVKGNFSEFFSLADAALHKLSQCKHFCVSAKDAERDARKKLKILFIIMTLSVVANSIMCSVFIIFLPGATVFKYLLTIVEKSDSILPSIHHLPVNRICWRIFCVIFMIQASALWLYSLMIFLIVAFILRHLLLNHSCVLEKVLSSQPRLCLQKYRLDFVEILEIVENADCLSHLYLSVNFASNLVMCMVLIFDLVYFQPNIQLVYLVAATFWITCGMVYLILPVYIAGSVAELTQKPRSVLQRHIYTDDEMKEVHLLYNIMAGREYGFSCSSMFIIEKSLVLTLLGLLMTYFFLLVQMRPNVGIDLNSNPTSMPRSTVGS